MSLKLDCGSNRGHLNSGCGRSPSKFGSVLVVCALFASSFSGCGNIFTDVSNQTSDDAILYDANRALAGGNWSTAISKVALLTPATRNQRTTQVLLASAYAGRCGLDAINLANTFQTSTGTTSFFGVIKAAFLGGGAVQEADCVTSQAILQTIWGQTAPVSSNPITENILIAFVGLAQAGTIINRWGDPSSTGTVVWSRPLNNDPCDAANGDTSLPIAEVNQVVVGVSLAIQGLLAAGTSQAGSLQQILTMCTGAGVLVPTGICSVSKTSSVTAGQRTAMRALLEETTNGIGLKVFNNDFPNTLATCGDMN